MRRNRTEGDWITDVPVAIPKKTKQLQKEPDLVDETAVEQPQFYLYERYGKKKHAVRFSYSTTMKSVFIDYARKIGTNSA